jgi:predicted metal-binding protein
MSTEPRAGGRTFVVIGGLARSGTQLTRRVIGSHSAIAVTNKEFKVKEVDCWCSGDRVCRFDVKPVV